MEAMADSCGTENIVRRRVCGGIPPVTKRVSQIGHPAASPPKRSLDGAPAEYQDKLFEGGNASMDREFPRLDHLIRASIVRDK